MYKKYGLFLFWALIATMPAQAIQTSNDAWAWWGYDTSKRNASGGSLETGFFLAGGTNKTAHGTHSDEYGGVALIATQLVEHGGKFCPYQIQCANKRKKKKSWTMYYEPTYGNTRKAECVWLCEDGYSGAGCTTAAPNVQICKNQPVNNKTGGVFAGVKMSTSGGDANQKESAITGLDQWNINPENDVIIAATSMGEHGGIFQPVRITCGRDNWKDIDSFISTVTGVGGTTQKTLCAEGYKPQGPDCVPINPSLCEAQVAQEASDDKKFCDGFDKTKYDNSVHYMETVNGCVKYFCIDDDMAFASATDTKCTECATGVKGGPNPKNGTCVKCDTGEYFDKNAGTCKSAGAYTTTDLQYGKGQTKNTRPEFDDQCWTKAEPSEYEACVNDAKKNN